MTASAAAPLLTVVTYHFVHPAERSVMPGLKHLELGAFVRQLSHIRQHYTPIGAAELIRALDEGASLPPQPVLLTFDDGYRCHYRDALPALEAAGMPAVFFPVASSALERRVLDVNKIQCVIAATPDISDLVQAIESEVDSATIAELRGRWWKRSRWDPEPVVYVKRLLQHALPEQVRLPLVDGLFAALVSSDERSFADELYMSVDELRELGGRGVTVGAHGDRHLRLPTLDTEAQAREIDGALRILDAVGVSRRRFVYSYANGEHDDRSVALLLARDCAAAFTTGPDIATLNESERFALPRFDTNDLPAR